MTPKEELKNFVSQMNLEQFQLFIDKMQLLLSEEVDVGRNGVASYGVKLEEVEACDCEEETAPEATNNRSGKAEQKSNQLNRSASILPKDKGECQA